jgi:DNA-binding SARP family transcriptional activator
MLAKLRKPRLHQPVLRSRLFARLDQRSEHPVLWISGPAGAGKTTLAASYIESRGIESFWIQLDPGDSDPATFFYYLRKLAESLTEADFPALPILTPELALNLPAFSHRFFRALFTCLPAKCVLVIDNVHDAANPDLELILREGLNEVPAEISVFILSRQQLPAALGRLRLSGELDTLGWEDLKFSEEETRAFSAPHGVIDGEAIEQLRIKVDGWAAGLALLLANTESDNALPADSVLPDGSGAWSNESLFDYFAGEVFARATMAQQRTLLSTALLPEFTAAMAQALSGEEHADQILDQLYKSQFFLTRRPGEPPVYQYHDLFRAFLRHRLELEKSAQEIAGIKLLAADTLALHGQTESAIELFLSVHDHGRAVSTIRSVAGQMVGLGRGNVLLAWLAMLPEDVVLADPWLTYWRGAAVVWADPAKAYQDFERAYLHFRDRSDHEGQLRSVMSLIEAIEFTLGDFRAKDPWTAELLRLLQPALPLENDPTRLRAWALVTASMTDRSKGCISALDEGVKILCDSFDQIGMEPDLRLHIGWVLLLYGFVSANADICRRALFVVKDMPEFEECSPSARCNWLMSEAWYHFSRADWVRSIASLDRLVTVAQEYRIRAFELLARSYSFLFRIIAGDREESVREYAALLAVTDDRQYRARWVLLKCGALLHCYRGEFHQATQLIGPVIAAADAQGIPDASASTRLDMAAVCVVAGNRAYAEKLLSEAVQVIEGTITAFTDGAIHAIRAMLSLHAGDTATAHGEIARCLAALHDPAHLGMFAVLPGIPSQICHEAIAADIEPEFACELVKNLNLTPPPGAPEAWPWPVKIHALGTFDINLPHGPMETGGRTPYKVLEMLKRLIAAGPRGLTANALSDTLWPDAEGDSALISLRTTVHRLRRLLNCDAALQTQDGRVALNRQSCWVDAFEFESVNADVTDPALAARAIALYGGPLMPDESDGHICLQRERLQTKYLRLVTSLGRSHEAHGEWSTAARVYVQALDTDPSNDVFFMRLIKCLREAGDHDTLTQWGQRRIRLAQTGVAPLSREVEDLLAHASSRS